MHRNDHIGLEHDHIERHLRRKEKEGRGNRDEWEIAGYRDVLATIHESHDYIPVRPNTILQLHRDLCGEIVKIGDRRYASYVWNRENDG